MLSFLGSTIHSYIVFPQLMDLPKCHRNHLIKSLCNGMRYDALLVTDLTLDK